MIINKREFSIGTISLVLSAVLQSIISCKYQNDWLILVLLCLYAVVFLKYWHECGIKYWLNSKCSKKTLKLIGVMMLFVGLSLLPQSFGKILTEAAEFVAYIISFICWMLGLFLIQVSTEKV